MRVLVILSIDWTDASPVLREVKRLPSGAVYTILHGDFSLAQLMQGLRVLPERVLVFSTQTSPPVVSAIQELGYTAPIAVFYR